MESRLADIDEARLSGDQRKVFDEIRSGPRGVVEGPLRVWLHSPELAQKAQALGAFCRYGTSLPPRLSELAILVVGAAWRAGFEWAVHAPIALSAGISADHIETLRTGKSPIFVNEDEAAVFTFVHELIEDKNVSDCSYKRLRKILPDSSIVELVGIAGYYSLISMTINAFNVALPQGTANPFLPVE